mmetsp:Transcript_4195/g.14746  ORF Transcript_4195/g.14746 Transcript_4195/m.14746 type:complete len:258 (-) Transcript_4195:383-1156(-)
MKEPVRGVAQQTSPASKPDFFHRARRARRRRADGVARHQQRGVTLDDAVTSRQRVAVALLAHEREVRRPASSRGAQTKRSLDLFHAVRARVVVVTQLLARLHVPLRVKVDAVHSLDRLQRHLHVRVAAVRQARGVVVVVHRVHEQDREPLRVPGRSLELHVVKLGGPGFAHAAVLLSRLDRVLLRLPRPRRGHLAEEVDDEVARFHAGRTGRAHDAEAFSMHGEHLRGLPRVPRQFPQRLGARDVILPFLVAVTPAG